MSKNYRIGVIGFAHMHVNELIDDFDRLANTEWVACSDHTPQVPSLSTEPGTRKANIQRALKVTKIPRFYEDYHQMLAQESFDVIIVCTENAYHAQVVKAVVEKGIDVVVEKPMATNLTDALEMARAAKYNGTSLIVNWPSTWWGHLRKAHQLLQDGIIGSVVSFKYRNHASLGPLAWGQKVTEEEKAAEWWHRAETGGGAYLDYCCYGANLSRWFIGEAPIAAYGLQANLNSHYGNADDNGVIVARYPKSLAILEGSWTMVHGGVLNGPVIYGTEGTLVCNDSQVLIYKEKSKDEPTLVYDGEPLPTGRENIAQEVIHHLETKDPLHPTLDIPINLDAMALLDAGIKAAKTGQEQPVHNQYWKIG